MNETRRPDGEGDKPSDRLLRKIRSLAGLLRKPTPLQKTVEASSSGTIGDQGDDLREIDQDKTNGDYPIEEPVLVTVSSGDGEGLKPTLDILDVGVGGAGEPDVSSKTVVELEPTDDQGHEAGAATVEIDYTQILSVDLIELLASDDQNRLANGLYRVARLNLEHATYSLSYFLTHNTSEASQQYTISSLYYLGEALTAQRSRASETASGQPFALTEPDTQALTTYFTELRKLIPGIRERKEGSQIDNQLLDTVNRNPELLPMVTELVRDMVQAQEPRSVDSIRRFITYYQQVDASKCPEGRAFAREMIDVLLTTANPDYLNHAINLATNRDMPLAEVADHISYFLTHNTSEASQQYTISSLYYLGEALTAQRSRASETASGQPFALTEPDTKALTTYFTELQNTLLPNINEMRPAIVPQLHSLLNQYRELTPFVVPLTEILLQTDNANIIADLADVVRYIYENPSVNQEGLRIIGQCLQRSEPNAVRMSLQLLASSVSLENTLLTINGSLAQNESDTFIDIYPELIGTLERVMARHRRDFNGVIEFSPNEQTYLQNLFNTLTTNLPRVQTRSGGSNLAEAYRSLLNRNPEIRVFAETFSKKIAKLIHEQLAVSMQRAGGNADQMRRIDDEDFTAISKLSVGIDRFQFLNTHLSGLTRPDREQLLQGIAQAASDPRYGETRRKLLETIFLQTESRSLNLGSVLQRSGLSLENLGEVLNDEAILALVKVLASNMSKYRFQLGELLVAVDLNNIPEETRIVLAPHMADLEFKIKPENGFWYLCGDAEPRLQESMRNTAVVVVKDANGKPLLLVKFRGKFSGICLQNFGSHGATFLAGNWYSPADDGLKRALRTAFDQGNSSIVVQEGEWVIMRSAREYGGLSPEQLLEQTRSFAANVPDKFPFLIDGMPRSEYRNRRDEIHG